MDRKDSAYLSQKHQAGSMIYRPLQNTLRITFCLPVTGHIPIGGHKIIYEYANRLSERGHKITLVHPSVSRRDCGMKEQILRHLINGKRYLTGEYRPDSWFNLSPSVDYSLAPDLSEKYVPDADVVIATAWQTAEWVNEYSSSKGRKFYFIQHLETWNGPEDRVHATWDFPVEKIAIARWLQMFAEDRGQSCHYVPNGLDFSTFGKDLPVEKRDPFQVLMLYHRQEFKGSVDGICALAALKNEFPQLKVNLFGVFSRPKDIPGWIGYFQNPDQPVLRQLYNQAAIFISPSIAEGWPLPPAEAMQCGTAVVGTDIGGHREYMEPEVTALLCATQNPSSIENQVRRLLLNPRLRAEIAESGYRSIQRFVWSKSVDSLEGILTGMQ